MSHSTRAIFLFLTIVAVLLVSAVGTTSVYADDGTPPPPPTETSEGDPPTGETEPAPTEVPAEVEPPASEGEPEATEPVATEPAVVEPVATEPPVVEPVATEPAVVEPVATELAVTEPLDEEALPEATPVAEEAPLVEEPAPAEVAETAGSILEQVPDNTTVTVLNAEGEAQPLTTQDSADAILTGDPIWCPASVVFPSPGANGCTDPMANFTELLEFLKLHEGELDYQKAGTIYVEMGTYAGSESIIDFNAYEFQYINNYDLTLQGGWDTTDNSKTDTTVLNVPIVIGTSTNPWAGSVTINNIWITGASDETGLTLYSDETITLSNVQVSESEAGAFLDAGEHVAIADSKFNNNKKFGAQINAGGVVQIRNSEFSNNKSKYDEGFGLEIDNEAKVSLTFVTANNNEKFGADIQSTGPVTVTGSFFNGNISYTGSCWNKAATGGYGLQIVTTSWAYLDEEVDEEGNLIGVEANENYLFGARIETGADGAYIWNSTFNDNGLKTNGYGIEVISDGYAELVEVTANNNKQFGANVQAQGDVNIITGTFNGNKSYKYSGDGISYYGYGIQVVTDGRIFLRQVTASDNNLFGAHLEGFDVSIAGYVVNDVLQYSIFSNNGSGTKTLTGKGLEIIAQNEVALSAVKAENNQLFGANIQAAGDVAIENSFFNGHMHTYTSYCKGSVTTGGYGLEVVSTNGDIALSVVEANNNFLYGAKLTGVDVSIDGDAGDNLKSLFNNNKQFGLEINSTGEVSLDMVEANENKLFGADIEAQGVVSVYNSVFSGNQSYTYSSCKGKTFKGYGLKVVTVGPVILSGVTAKDNYEYGASLTGTIVNVADSVFSSNGTDDQSDHIGFGLEIKSTGDNQVTLSGVTASDNQLFGTNIQAEGYVLISRSTFSGNQSYTYSSCKGKTYDGYGLKVVTTGDIRLNSVTAQYNYLFGARLEGANVTVSGNSASLSSFSFNASPLQSGKTPTGRGLEVISSGTALLEYVNASNNQLFGADVQAAGEVEVVSSVFADNIYYTYSSCKGTKSAGYGLKVVTTDPVLGTIALTSVQAFDNGAEGAILESPTTVAVTESSFNTNGADGLNITADGDVTLTGVTADGNKGDGVQVKGVCTNAVHVYDGTFTNNSKYGIKVLDATYTPHGTQTFGGNGYGNVFESGCVTSTTNVSGNTSQNNTGYSGSYFGSWYWYWLNYWYGHQ